MVTIINQDHPFKPRPGDPSHPYCQHWVESTTGDTPYGRIDMQKQCGFPRASHPVSKEN
jgi:hypothetical protein